MSVHLLRTYVAFHRFIALAWMIGLAFFAFFIAVLYRSLAESGIEELWESYPEALRAAVGLDPEAPLAVGGRFAIESWLAMEFLGWMALVIALYGVVYGAGTIAREAEQGTLDLILSQPVARYRFVVSKSLVFLVSTAALVVTAGVALQAGVAAAGESLNTIYLYLTLFQGALVGLAVAGYAIAFSGAFLSVGRAAAVAGLLTVILYILEIVSRTVDGAEWVGNVSLFHFYQADHILRTGELSWTGVGVCSAVAVGGVALAAVLFQRRDIPA
ncbi:MAG: ABC transporter permease subunit [Dehalococcoidia bacterium]